MATAVASDLAMQRVHNAVRDASAAKRLQMLENIECCSRATDARCIPRCIWWEVVQPLEPCTRVEGERREALS